MMYDFNFPLLDLTAKTEGDLVTVSTDKGDITRPSLMSLDKKAFSYFYGFAICDGGLYSKKSNKHLGQFKIEIKGEDVHILESFAELLKDFSPKISYSTRDTNYKKDFQSAIFCIYDMNFRYQLNALGFPVGKKDEIVQKPNFFVSEIDFLRGLIDGNGSVGVTGAKKGFVAFTTKSDNMMSLFQYFIDKYFGIHKVCKRNKRAMFNFMVTGKHALHICQRCYYKDCLSLSRKYAKSRKVIKQESSDVLLVNNFVVGI